MSTAVMAQCWPLAMPPTAKAVLISLADNANDHGECWPSLATIAVRTCFSERAVQNAIKWLEVAGALVADRSNGRHTRYHVTPAAYAPPQEIHPAAGASLPPQQVRQPPQEIPKPPQQVPSNRKEPSRTVKATVRECPPDVPKVIWADWLTLRAAKKAPVTETVMKNARAEAGKAEMPLARFLEIWCARGSQGLQADWLKPHELGLTHGTTRKLSAAEQTRAHAFAREQADQSAASHANGSTHLVGSDGGDLWPPLEHELRE